MLHRSTTLSISRVPGHRRLAHVINSNIISTRPNRTILPRRSPRPKLLQQYHNQIRSLNHLPHTLSTTLTNQAASRVHSIITKNRLTPRSHVTRNSRIARNRRNNRISRHTNNQHHPSTRSLVNIRIRPRPTPATSTKSLRLHVIITRQSLRRQTNVNQRKRIPRHHQHQATRRNVQQSSRTRNSTTIDGNNHLKQ